jgi:hypothetical protein
MALSLGFWHRGRVKNEDGRRCRNKDEIEKKVE